MSYILDALAQSHTAGAQSGLRRLSRRALWQTITIGALLAVVLVLAIAYWDTVRKPRPKIPDATARSASAPRNGLGEIPSMAARPSRRASAPAAGTAAVAARAEPAPAPALAPAPAPARFRPPVALNQPLPNPSPGGPGGAYASPRLSAAGMVAAAAPRADPRVVALADLKPMSVLPADTRALLAQMKVRVLFYAPQRKNRFVMIESRELREGDDLMDGVRLEEITDNGLVLRHKGFLVLMPAARGG